jgi:hypothetical protein
MASTRARTSRIPFQQLFLGAARVGSVSTKKVGRLNMDVRGHGA